MKEDGDTPDLLERIAADPRFHITATELHELTDPSRFVGRAPQQVDRFLEAWVEPVLARYQNDAGARVGAPEVRV
jgi:adenylosuccinate lyase